MRLRFLYPLIHSLPACRIRVGGHPRYSVIQRHEFDDVAHAHQNHRREGFGQHGTDPCLLGYENVVLVHDIHFPRQSLPPANSSPMSFLVLCSILCSSLQIRHSHPHSLLPYSDYPGLVSPSLLNTNPPLMDGRECYSPLNS